MPKVNLFESQLFLDDRWIADSIRLGRVWHPARKRVEPVLRPDHAWEGVPVMYGSVLYHDGKFKMWYIGWHGVWRGAICYAESDDGLRWTKPALGLVEVEGSRSNNFILGGPGFYVDNLGVIDDPADRRWPLKMIYWQSIGRKTEFGLTACRSQDGIHWESLGMVLPRWGDRTNILPTREDGKYVVFGRIPEMTAGKYGCRIVSRIESSDLIHWSQPELVLKPDPEDEPHMQIYSATAFKYESMYIGFIERMHMAPDVLDPEIWFSHDSHAWSRSRTRPAFIERGAKGAWDEYWISTPSSAPIRRKRELLFHYSGRACSHTHQDSYRAASIGLASLRIDGFCSLQAQEKEGWLVTPPMRWVKGELALNADPRRDITTHPGYGGGQVSIEVRDARGNPLKGFAFDDCVPETRNIVQTDSDADSVIKWKSGRRMVSLAGRQICLAFKLRDAHLYSFKAKTSAAT